MNNSPLGSSNPRDSFLSRFSAPLFVRNLLRSICAPDTCASCDANVPWRTIFCATCVEAVVARTESHPTKLAPFAYGGSIAEAITSFKYGGRPDLARPLANLMLRSLKAVQSEPVDVVIPVPLHAQRLVERGYNQAALLARPVARALGVRVAAGALERTRNTPRQVGLDRSFRRENVEGAFRVRQPSRVSGKRVLLVDDVRTTGSTLDECMNALYSAGAVRVRSLVIAATES